jgi:hypothetical protein
LYSAKHPYNRSEGRGERGGALIYVLGVIAALGLLFSVLIQWNQGDLELYGKARINSQQKGIALGGLSYGQAYLSQWKDSRNQERNIDYTGNLGPIEIPQSDSQKSFPASFSLSILPQGLYSYVQSTGSIEALQKQSGVKISHRLGGLVGQTFEGNAFPVLVLKNQQGGVAVGGTGSIEGDILLLKGTVQKATNPKVQYRGTTPHRGSVLNNRSSLWESTEISYDKADKWVQQREQMYRANTLIISAQTPFIIQTEDEVTLLQDTGKSIRNTLFRSPPNETLHISGGIYYNCEFLGDNIQITGNPTFHNSIMYASQNLTISGSPILNGQFMARDSLSIDIVESTPSSKAPPTFYLHGKNEYSLLSLSRFSGSGIFIFRNMYKTQSPQHISTQTHVRIDSEASITGLVSVAGNVDLRGNITGSLLCDNFSFYKDNTLFTGHLYQGSIQPLPKDILFHIPLLFSKGGPVKFMYQEELVQ